MDLFYALLLDLVERDQWVNRLCPGEQRRQGSVPAHL